MVVFKASGQASDKQFFVFIMATFMSINVNGREIHAQFVLTPGASNSNKSKQSEEKAE